MTTERKIKRWIPAQSTQDGDGVNILRIAGRHLNQDLDPFLLLDELKGEDESDYMGGFPPHPHRGFETITYMLDGQVRHKDHMGNEDVIGSGDVQWMTAGSGVIHSEMPEKSEGLFHGFQLWLNLPASEKMSPADYKDVRASEILRHTTEQNVEILSIAGEVKADGQTLTGPISGPPTDPIYLDVNLPPHTKLRLDVPGEHRILVYVYEGKLHEGSNELSASSLLVYSDEGDQLVLSTKGSGAKVLFLGGKPLNEPVVQHGPFVMNTQEEINQAISDYQQGRLVS